jgi:hypothetical protein
MVVNLPRKQHQNNRQTSPKLHVNTPFNFSNHNPRGEKLCPSPPLLSPSLLPSPQITTYPHCVPGYAGRRPWTPHTWLLVSTSAYSLKGRFSRGSDGVKKSRSRVPRVYIAKGGAVAAPTVEYRHDKYYDNCGTRTVVEGGLGEKRVSADVCGVESDENGVGEGFVPWCEAAIQWQSIDEAV